MPSSSSAKAGSGAAAGGVSWFVASGEMGRFAGADAGGFAAPHPTPPSTSSAASSRTSGRSAGRARGGPACSDSKGTATQRHLAVAAIAAKPKRLGALSDICQNCCPGPKSSTSSKSLESLHLPARSSGDSQRSLACLLCSGQRRAERLGRHDLRCTAVCVLQTTLVRARSRDATAEPRRAEERARGI